MLLTVEVGTGLLIERDGFSGRAHIVYTENLCPTLSSQSVEEGRSAKGFLWGAAQGTINHTLA